MCSFFGFGQPVKLLRRRILYWDMMPFTKSYIRFVDLIQQRV
jgi:hypothetical protein